MKILVICTSYPDDNLKYGGMFFHIRNKYYLEHGFDITVLNFTACNDYIIEDVHVITLDTYNKKKENIKYDILISHAPDMTYHYKFLLKNDRYFKKIMLFFHGFEVLNYKELVPYHYSFESKGGAFLNVKSHFANMIKKRLWARYFKFRHEKLHYVFVSKWMYDEFLKWIGFDSIFINKKSSIIPNCIGKIFEERSYDEHCDKKYDFITIRGNLDAPKYCIDIVNSLAISNSDKKFLIIGKGEFFEHISKAYNIDWIDRVLTPEEIIKYLNISRCALMPTRCDAQGLMMCEMASFGIPLITSDIQVCRDVLSNFNNVTYIDNENILIKLDNFIEQNETSVCKIEEYFAHNTIYREVELFKNM